MCGVVAWCGDVDSRLVDRVVEESTIRGLHHLGSKEIKGKAGIYHARYCTSGKDNQPIEFGGSALAFNGVIDMGTKKEMERRFKVKMQTDNDGELYLVKQAEVMSRINTGHCSFAGVILSKTKLRAVRNEKRPLWVIETVNGVLIASTRDILRRAGAPYIYAELLKPNKVYEWTI